MNSTTVFASSCTSYAQAGWPCVIPVPPEAKFPPPEGFTGATGRDTGPNELEYWAGTLPNHSIALRMPDGIIGIDIDDYPKGETVKRGGAQLAEKIAAWGPLPPTWSSTARGGNNGDGPGTSRIMFFLVPAGRYATKLGPDIEIIQRHHRYAVVAPSVHHSVGAAYQWYDPEGHLSARMPAPSELAELPEIWVQHLAEGATDAGPMAAGASDGLTLLGQLLQDDRNACADCANAEADALRLLNGALPGSRHDTMTERVYHLVLLAAEGHPGTGPILERLRSQWDALTAGENRGGEFENMLTTAARKAVTHIGATQMRNYDPCLIQFGVSWAAPAPDGPPEMAESLAPPKLVSVRTYIGADPFDPDGQLDHTLAQSVLERMHPALRYAADADTWLLRGPWAWTAPPGELSQWAITELTWLMPRGDAKADKDTPEGQKEIQRAARRARFGTTAGANAIARKMKSHVLAGTHPSSVELSALDSEPEILWAGGIPWDLRASRNGPMWIAPELIDPGTPHLHSASIMPEWRPTPLWNAFVKAVWPDEELRRWALRVLSISFTGYPDKTLPLLRGDTDRGKTSLISLLMNVLGTYAHAADTKLLSGADRSHASIVMVLKGRRLSFIDEAPRSGHQAQERLKQLTGGSALTGNFMNKNPVTFDPTHTLILTANEESEPPLTDPAVRRRVRLIPCTGDPAEIIAARAAIGGMGGRAWQAEAPGVLAFMMSEAAAWLADPASAYSSAAPLSAQDITEQIAAGQDVIRTWVEDETEPYEEGTRSRPLYQEFVSSCRRNNLSGSAIPSETLWGRRVTELGYPPESRRDCKYRKLRTHPLDFRGEFSHVPPSPEVVDYTARVSGSPPDVPGCVGSENKPDTPNPPRSDPPETSSVSGVSGSSGMNEKNKKEDTLPIYIAPNGKNPPTRHADPLYAPSDLEKEPVSGTFSTRHSPGQPDTLSEDATHSDENGPQNWDGSQPPDTVGPSSLNPVTQSDNDAKSPLAPKKTRKREPKPKPLKRIGPDPELAGPVHVLPAVVDREGKVASCTLEQAAVLAANRELTVDVETTGYPPGHPEYKLRTVQLGDENLAVVFDAADSEHQAVIREVLAGAEILHAHSAAADLVPLERAGLCTEEAWARMDDTVLRAKLADPKLSGSDADGLKQLAADVVPNAVIPAANEARKKLFASGKWLMDTDALTPVERSGWAQVDSCCETMIRYAASDVLDTAPLPRLLPYVDERILDRERAVQRICARVTHRGLRLDGEHIRTLIAEHEAAKAEVSVRVQAAGIENPGSAQQVGKALAERGVTLPRTKPSVTHPDGQPSAAEAVLTPLAAGTGPGAELAADVLAYREHATILGLTLEPFRVFCDHGDGRVRPTIYTLGTNTGRMSCVRPNLQQIKRTGGLRACITADPGMVLISADFQAVELRTAAALAGDQALYEMIMEGDAARARGDKEGANAHDLHWKIARQVWGPQATKGDRYNAKRSVFGRLYGAGIAKIAATLGISEAEAKAVADTLDALAPGVAQWSRGLQKYASDGGRSIQAYSGRIIWLDRKISYKSANYAIQGNAKEFLADGLLKWEQTQWGGGVILPVHDEVIAVVPEQDADEATQALVAAMSTSLNGMPILAEPSEPGFAWADAS